MRLLVCKLPVPRLRKFALAEKMVFVGGRKVLGEVKYNAEDLRDELEDKNAKFERVEVPAGKIEWGGAIKALGVYLKPLKLSEQITYSKRGVPFFVECTDFLQLYRLAGALGMSQLQTRMEMAIYGFQLNELIGLYQCEQKVHKKGVPPIPCLHLSIMMMIVRNTGVANGKELSEIEFTEVVDRLVKERIYSEEMIADWLIEVYEQYYTGDCSNLYDFELSSILKALHVSDAKSAFARWLFSAFFPYEDEDVFVQYAKDFPLDATWHLSSRQAEWLATNRCEIDVNGQPVFDIESYSAEELESLVPYLQKNAHLCEHVTTWLMEKGATLEDSKILRRLAGYLPFLSLRNMINGKDPSFVMRYTLKWLLCHESAKEYDPLFEAFRADPTKPENGYYLLKLVASRDFLAREVAELFHDTAYACKVFEWTIENVQSLTLSSAALSELRSVWKFTGEELDTFIKFLIEFDMVRFRDDILLPVCKESFWSTLELLASSRRKGSRILVSEICQVAIQEFPHLDCSQIRLLAQIVAFNKMAEAGVDRGDTEDGFFYYASVCPRSNWHHIRYNRVSLRMASMFILSQQINFQFECSPSAFCTQIDTAEASFDLNEWLRPGPICRIDGTLAVYNMSTTCNMSCNLDWIYSDGITMAESIDDCMSSDYIVLYQPNGSECHVSITDALNSALAHAKTVMINAQAMKTLSSLAPEDGETDWLSIFNFEETNLDQIDWMTPPDSYIPSKENLMVIDIDNDTDIYFHSIPCLMNNSGNIAVTVEMASKRLFAAKITGTNLCVFNFDLDSSTFPDRSVIDTACQRQICQTLSWLTK